MEHRHVLDVQLLQLTVRRLLAPVSVPQVAFEPGLHLEDVVNERLVDAFQHGIHQHSVAAARDQMQGREAAVITCAQRLDALVLVIVG